MPGYARACSPTSGTGGSVWCSTIVAVLATIGLVAGYLRKVVAPQYPGKNNPEE